MANPICLSPLKFYDDIRKQCHHKSFAFNNITPLLSRAHTAPGFQFVLPTSTNFSSVYIRNTKDVRVTGNVLSSFVDAGLSISDVSGFKVVSYLGSFPILNNISEGYYYIEIKFSNGLNYYSEIFCISSKTDDYLEIEYWNQSGNLFIKNGIISFENSFRFNLLLDTEIGKPEYSFEEEVTKRLGYNFIESQVSKKIYKFTAVVPEYICDAMRIIRMCDNKIITSKNDEYDATSFEISVEWQTQGDLASASCEFETDNVIVNLGSFEV